MSAVNRIYLVFDPFMLSLYMLRLVQWVQAHIMPCEANGKVLLNTITLQRVCLSLRNEARLSTTELRIKENPNTDI